MDKIENFISIGFVIFNIALIYIIIWCIETKIKTNNPNKQFKTVYKRIVTALTSILSGILFVKCFNENAKIIATSILLSIVFYDFIIKYAINGIKNWSNKHNLKHDN